MQNYLSRMASVKRYEVPEIARQEQACMADKLSISTFFEKTLKRY